MTAHVCTSPDPDRCLGHVLDAAVAEQRAMEKVRAEVERERHDEWWTEA
jgi:hypothetical protein